MVNLDKLIYNCYCELYQNSTPIGNFKLLKETSPKDENGIILIPFNDYEIEVEKYVEIVNKYANKLKHQKQMFKNTIALGCSPKFKQ